MHLLNQTDQSLRGQVTSGRHGDDVITTVVNVVQEHVILSSGLQDLGVLDSSELSHLLGVSEQNSRVQLHVDLDRLVVVDDQSIVVVALIVTGMVENGSGERILHVVREIIDHQSDDVLGIVLVVRQDSVHVSHIRLVSVVSVA